MMELLFVMAIMIGLAAVMAASIGPVQANMSRQRSRGFLKMLETGLEQFRAEYGSYPKCENPNDGANVLYRTLFGDYNEDGKPDWSATGGQDTSVKTFIGDLNPGTIDQATGSTKNPFVRMVLGKLILVDSWGTQLYYVGGAATKHNGRTEIQENGVPTGRFANDGNSYDLWSLGNDPDPSDDNDSMWLKNW